MRALIRRLEVGSFVRFFFFWRCFNNERRFGMGGGMFCASGVWNLKGKMNGII